MMDTTLIIIVFLVLALMLGLAWFFRHEIEKRFLQGRKDTRFVRVIKNHFQLEKIGNVPETILENGELLIAAHKHQLQLLATSDSRGQRITTSHRWEKIIPPEAIRSYFYDSEAGKMKRIWIHFIENQTWYALKIEMEAFADVKSDGLDLLRAMTNIAKTDVKLAFTRKTPFVHRGLTRAYLARQLIRGDWELLYSQQFFLIPNFLVFINQSGAVERQIPTKAIREIEAIERSNEPNAGILRFQAEGKSYCFALRDHEAWAKDLADAASKAQGINIEAKLLELRKSESL
jgi:hypothetical protein